MLNEMQIDQDLNRRLLIEKKIRDDIYENIMDLPAETRNKRLAVISPVVSHREEFLATYLSIPKEIVWIIITLYKKIEETLNPDCTTMDEVCKTINVFNTNLKTTLVKHEAGSTDFAMEEIAKYITEELSDDDYLEVTNKDRFVSSNDTSKNDDRISAILDQQSIVSTTLNAGASVTPTLNGSDRKSVV